MQFMCSRSVSFLRQSLLNGNKMRVLSSASSGSSDDPPVIDPKTVIYDAVATEPDIPSSVRQREESIDLKRKRLLYQSRKRGILENDLILGSFAAKYLQTFNEHQLEQFDRIINMPSNDWELYYWTVGKKEVPEEVDNQVMALLIEHTRNRDKESRVRQPNLWPAGS